MVTADEATVEVTVDGTTTGALVLDSTAGTATTVGRVTTVVGAVAGEAPCVSASTSDSVSASSVAVVSAVIA